MPTYPFDPSGTSPANLVSGEQHVLTASNYKDYQLIIPRYAPFFESDLVMRFQNANGEIRPLIKGMDYYLGYQFQTASLSTGKRLFGVIYFLDKTLQGVVMIDTYRTLGGDWNIDTNKIAEILADKSKNPLITSWEEVNDLPVYFPPVSHQWNIYDMVGMSEIVQSIGDIEDAIRTKGGGAIDDHINDHNNPHMVTKTQVGLGLVNNFGTASSQDTINGLSTILYTTPKGVFDAIKQLVKTPLDNHIADTDNPHQLTAAKIGAVTQAELSAALQLKLDSNATAQDSNMLEGMDFAQVKAEVLTGTASNSAQLGGKSLAEVLAEAGAVPADDTSKFAGMTPAQYNEYLISTMRQFICYQADIDFLDPNDNITPIISYQPVGYTYVNAADITTGKESLHIVTIHSSIPGESPVTELRIRHVGNVCQWSTSSKNSGVLDVGQVMTVETESPGTGDIYKVILFVKLAPGARFIKSIRVSGYYYGYDINPLEASAAMPEGFLSATYKPDLFGQSGQARTIYTGTVLSANTANIAGVTLNDQVSVLVKDNANPTDYYDAASVLTVIQTATGLTLTNESAEDLEYRVLVDSTETVNIVPIP